MENNGIDGGQASGRWMVTLSIGGWQRASRKRSLTHSFVLYRSSRKKPRIFCLLTRLWRCHGGQRRKSWRMVTALAKNRGITNLSVWQSLAQLSAAATARNIWHENGNSSMARAYRRHQLSIRRRAWRSIINGTHGEINNVKASEKYHRGCSRPARASSAAATTRYALTALPLCTISPVLCCVSSRLAALRFAAPRRGFRSHLCIASTV